MDGKLPTPSKSELQSPNKRCCIAVQPVKNLWINNLISYKSCSITIATGILWGRYIMKPLFLMTFHSAWKFMTTCCAVPDQKYFHCKNLLAGNWKTKSQRFIKQISNDYFPHRSFCSSSIWSKRDWKGILNFGNREFDGRWVQVILKLRN